MEEPFIRRPTTNSDLNTSVRIRGTRAIYEVYTCKPLYEERLLHMGFARSSNCRFTRNLSNAGDVFAIHSYFAQNLEEMLLQSARLHNVPWDQTLEFILSRVRETQLRWFLYGSVALAIRGIDAKPRDLDLWVSDAQLAGMIFNDVLVEPVTTMTGWIAERGGRAFAGCLFEWLSDVHPEIDDPEPHEHGPIAQQSLEQVYWHGHAIRVPPVALHLSVARRRGLTERVALIQSHMHAERQEPAP